MTSEIAKHLRHNLAVNLLDGAFFGMAIGFASFVTIIPLFVSTMTESAILIGLIPAIHSVGWQLPQLFTADRVARLTRYKPMTLAITIHERLPFLGLALVAWLSGRVSNTVALVFTYMLLAWQGLGAGLTATAWQSLIAKIIPPINRGTFFGAQAAAANLLASVSAIIAGLILEKLDSPQDFIYCFLLASLAMVISWIFLAQTHESESAPISKSHTQREFWNGLGLILRNDTNFRRFLFARLLTPLGVMGFSFYTVFAVRQHGVSEYTIGFMTAFLTGVQILANPIMGFLGDRWSHRGVMEIGLFAAFLSATIAWFAPDQGWFYLVFLFAGIANVAIWTIGISMTLEFGSEIERPSYIGLANSLVAPLNFLAPFLGGWIADTMGYTVTFQFSAFLCLITIVVFHFAVRDPKRFNNSNHSKV